MQSSHLNPFHVNSLISIFNCLFKGLLECSTQTKLSMRFASGCSPFTRRWRQPLKRTAEKHRGDASMQSVKVDSLRRTGHFRKFLQLRKINAFDNSITHSLFASITNVNNNKLQNLSCRAHVFTQNISLMDVRRKLFNSNTTLIMHSFLKDVLQNSFIPWKG